MPLIVSQNHQLHAIFLRVFGFNQFGAIQQDLLVFNREQIGGVFMKKLLKVFKVYQNRGGRAFLYRVLGGNYKIGCGQNISVAALHFHLIRPIPRRHFGSYIGRLIQYFVICRDIYRCKIVRAQGMVHDGFNVEDARLFTNRSHFGFDDIGSFVEVQIFQKNDAIKNIEFELKENSQANPAKNLKKTLHGGSSSPKNYNLIIKLLILLP